MSRVLVTGGSGFVGQRLVAQLRAAGSDVTALRRGAEPRFAAGEISLDLCEPSHLDALLAFGSFETVVHLAGRVDISLRHAASAGAPPVPGRANVAALYRDNVLATANLADYCLQAGARQLIFASSQTVYGWPSEIPLTERAACAPLEHYASSKWCAERVLEVTSRQGLAVTVLRFPGVYAEDRSSGIVQTFTSQAVRDRRIRVTATFPLPLDVIHGADVVDAIAVVAAAPSSGFRTFNVATGEPCSLDVLADAIADLVPGCTVAHDGVPQPVVQLDPSALEAAHGWRAAPRARRLAGMVDATRRPGGEG